MPCRRNVVMQDLTRRYQDLLQQAFGQGSKAQRDLEVDPSGIMPESTPACWIEEQGSRLVDVESGVYMKVEVHATLLVATRSSTENQGLVQDQLNEVEAVLDLLFDISLGIAGVSYALLEDGVRSGHPGLRGEGQLEYPIRVRFARETALG
jgi:hypothetical protein